ncbi:MAG TPA: SGNH/GDSL hydrolase family protein [Puia sp.]|nr:SGNH/GDSL hydrolase family protein [Puia sp.]
MGKGVLFLITLLTTGLSVVSCNKSGQARIMLTPVNTDSGLISGQDSIPSADTSKTHTYLALGDSYTIGASVAVNDRYPVQTVSLLRTAGYSFQDPEIIATSGWTTTNLLEAIQGKTAAVPYDVVTLLIGVNNQYQGGTADNYRDELTRLLKQCIQLSGNKASHVIVISIPDYSVTPFAKGLNRTYISSQIDAFNKINHDVSDSYQTLYLNVTDESREALSDPSLIASDGLHFSGKEYGIWASALKPMMEKVITGNKD